MRAAIDESWLRGIVIGRSPVPGGATWWGAIRLDDGSVTPFHAGKCCRDRTGAHNTAVGCVVWVRGDGAVTAFDPYR